MKAIAEISPAPAAGSHSAEPGRFDVRPVREDFPILRQQVHGKPLVYLDNAATTQKPQAVIDAIVDYYTRYNANIHRGVYELSQKATDAFEQAREKVAKFIHAPHPAECIFVRGTTEAANLVASSWGRANLKAGDEVLIGEMEHHSNIVPWQLVGEQTGAKVRVIPMSENGELMLGKLDELLSERTKMVAVQHVSNALGTIQDVETIARKAKAVGARVFVDGAQWVAHHPTDVRKLGCDFYAFSGHKLYGPTGIGVLWGRLDLLKEMPPWQGGGDMIEMVSFERTTYAGLPNKFEAGTPDIAGAVGLGAAIDYISGLGFERFEAHERELLGYGTERLGQVPGLRIVGTAKRKVGVISFRMEDPPIASLDLGQALDREGIAVRTGHHCCMPIMQRLSIDSTARASFALYNTTQEIDALAEALEKIRDAKGRNDARMAGAHPSPSLEATDIVFPGPAGESPNAVAEELVDLFEFLPDKIAKAEQIVDYAKELPPYFDILKKLTQRVPGCQAEVYMLSRRKADDPDRLEFVADANAEIVRGEIVMLQKLFSGQRAKDILDFDVESFFRRIGFERFLTSQRRTGLASMIERIRTLAAGVEKHEGKQRQMDMDG
jgi:cysteine desulfurase / selenocysteine lyase